MTGAPAAPGLLLVAHGSSDPAATAAATGLADSVRTSRPGLTVAVGFLDHAEPAAAQALAQFGTVPVVVVPLLLADAFHAQTDVQGLVDGARAAGQWVTIAAVVGSDARVELAALELLDELGAEPATHVVLVSAGTSDPAARDTTQQVATSLAARRRGPVEVAYLSAGSPTLDEALSAHTATDHGRVVLRWLLFPGRFADLAAVTAANAGANCTRLLGAHPLLADAVLARYDSAAANAS